jgi:hypothetical protein
VDIWATKSLFSSFFEKCFNCPESITPPLNFFECLTDTHTSPFTHTYLPTLSRERGGREISATLKCCILCVWVGLCNCVCVWVLCALCACVYVRYCHIFFNVKMSRGWIFFFPQRGWMLECMRFHWGRFHWCMPVKSAVLLAACLSPRICLPCVCTAYTPPSQLF